MIVDKNYWKNRYQNQQTGWDIGYVSPPIAHYFDQLENYDLKILIPGCGNAYEAEYLYRKGFKNVFVLDITDEALDSFKRRFPEFPSENIICANFFEYYNTFDIIIEQTFFCALVPDQRNNYIIKMKSLLKPKGKLIGVLFAREFEKEGPPFGGTIEAYKFLFSRHFYIKTLENCYNSIDARMGNELFFIFENSI